MRVETHLLLQPARVSAHERVTPNWLLTSPSLNADPLSWRRGLLGLFETPRMRVIPSSNEGFAPLSEPLRALLLALLVRHSAPGLRVVAQISVSLAIETGIRSGRSVVRPHPSLRRRRKGLSPRLRTCLILWRRQEAQQRSVGYEDLGPNTLLRSRVRRDATAVLENGRLLRHAHAAVVGANL